MFPTPACKAVYWPNLLSPLSGSAAPPHARNERVYAMMLAAQAPGASDYGTLLFVRYSEPIPMPNLVVSALTSSDPRPHGGSSTTVTATVANIGDAEAAASTTQFSVDGTTVIGTVATPALPAGGSANVSVTWSTRGVRGDHVVGATADSAAVIDESNEDDNAATLAVTVRGNHVTNGSFDQTGPTGQPSAWTPAGTGAGTATGPDGSPAVSIAAAIGAGSSSWTSDAFPVQAGLPLTVAASVRATGLSVPASVSLAFADAGGNVLATTTALASALTGSSFVPLEATVTAPAGAVAARVVLREASLSGSVTVDDVGVYDG